MCWVREIELTLSWESLKDETKFLHLIIKKMFTKYDKKFNL